MSNDSLLIYSGGLDSTIMLHDYKDQISLAVTFDYGSKHNKKEIEFAKRNCKKLNIEHIVISLPFINKHFSSDLLKSGGEIPHGHYADETMKKTVVPFRNGIMLSIATGIAESRMLNGILIANHKGDHAIYPDCTEDFISTMAETMRLGTYGKPELCSPYCNLTKRDIVKRAINRDLPINFEDTYSCYEGGELHCGKCGTCVERKEALRNIDKTNYLNK